MAFPWVWEEGFETGATAATATSGSLIDVPHFTTLARFGMAPYRGAYCGRVKLAGGTTAQFWREDTAFDDLTASTTRYLRFYFYLGKDFVMAASDKFSLVELESVLNTTTEVAAGIQNNAGRLEFWWNETGAAATPGTIDLGTTTSALGKWIHAEIKVVLDAGGGNDGTITAYIDGSAAGTIITTLDQGAIVDAKFGAIGPDAGTSGTILFDDIKYDDAQIYKDADRFQPINRHITMASDHPIIGPGRFSVGITGTGTNAVLTLYDSDGIPNNLAPIAILRNTVANEFIPGHDLFDVKRGLYTVMSGTAAQAFLSIECGGLVSDATLINYGLRNAVPRAGG